MLSINPIPILNDNYIWHVTNGHAHLVVDPGDANAVRNALAGAKLDYILITHHHWDHTQGVEQLKQSYPEVQIYGPANSPFKVIDHALNDGEQIHLSALDLKLTIIAVPGHTLDHIAYVSDHWVFCGDTLFSIGCGRMFEGDAYTYQHSLETLATLPGSLLLFPTHEYTLANLEFARSILPDDENLMIWQQEVSQLRKQNKASLPVKLKDEITRNPFLRVADPQFQKMLAQLSQQKIDNKVDAFAVLRALKDKF
ncbi:hydroxyacylglutathione hydrolase [Gayadomonas joobiniege]|uniref:hydroxyacylglutathione hydrolase n=1 Tax=Gayadomonas joobiniege TaxID=1234606 RepID=UPI000474DD80|nr:hydroxyacylglutathione hydrolase [Gayadomonas joobiniege]